MVFSVLSLREDWGGGVEFIADAAELLEDVDDFFHVLMHFLEGLVGGGEVADDGTVISMPSASAPPAIGSARARKRVRPCVFVMSALSESSEIDI